MRLGNLDVFCNAVREEKERWPPESTHGIMWAAILELVEVCPTVDQEELPIVQQLRAEIKELNSEIIQYRDELRQINTALDSAAKWYLLRSE